jgi:hypothetical protein
MMQMGKVPRSRREPLVVTTDFDAACVDAVALKVELTEALVIVADDVATADARSGEVDGAVDVGKSEIL